MIVGADVTQLHDAVAFGWGCLGGAVAWVLTYVFPEIRALLARFRKPPLHKLVLALLLLACLVLVGGVASLILSPTTTGQAIALGIGGETLLGAALKTGAVAAPGG